MSQKKTPAVKSQPVAESAVNETPTDLRAAILRVSRDLMQRLENLTYETNPKLAVVMRLAELEAEADYGADHRALEGLAWLGVRMLCHDVLRDVEALQRASGAQDSGFATLADDEGGTE